MVCTLTQTMCGGGHTHTQMRHFTHDMKQTSYASYVASIFSLHNNVGPQIPKSNGNRASANYTYCWWVYEYLVCAM